MAANGQEQAFAFPLYLCSVLAKIGWDMSTRLLRMSHAQRVAVLVLFGLLTTPSFADPATERLEKLEAAVSALEKRIAALEGSSVQSSQERPKPTASGDWEDRSNWRLLRKGMSKGQVTEILGEPEKVEARGLFEYWRWKPPLGPSITFYDEKLYGWDEG